MNRFLITGLGCLLILAGCSGDEGTRISGSDTFGSNVRCLSGRDGGDPKRAAVAVKVENDPSAYPLSGLDDAEVVYEEVVEGGVTRFMAIYHCTGSGKVGPVRSSRIVDAAIMRPITHILAASGGNAQVIKSSRRRTSSSSTNGPVREPCAASLAPA